MHWCARHCTGKGENTENRKIGKWAAQSKQHCEGVWMPVDSVTKQVDLSLIQTSRWRIDKYEARKFSFTGAEYLCFGIKAFVKFNAVKCNIRGLRFFAAHICVLSSSLAYTCSTWLFKLFQLLLPQNVRMIFSPWILLQIHLKKSYWKYLMIRYLMSWIYALKKYPAISE